MKVQDTKLPGVKRIELAVFHDDRGYFLESYQQERYAQALDEALRFVQDNSSHSRQGVLPLRESDPRKLIPPLHGALLKNEQDVHLFERLAFMSRRKEGQN